MSTKELFDSTYLHLKEVDGGHGDYLSFYEYASKYWN